MWEKRKNCQKGEGKKSSGRRVRMQTAPLKPKMKTLRTMFKNCFHLSLIDTDMHLFVHPQNFCSVKHCLKTVSSVSANFQEKEKEEHTCNEVSLMFFFWGGIYLLEKIYRLV